MKEIIVTAGGCSEYIDNVRKITNSASGALGALIVERIICMTTEEVIVHHIGPKEAIAVAYSNGLATIIRHVTLTTQSVLEVMEHLLSSRKIDAVVHTMALADYRPAKVFTLKMMTDGLRKNLKEFAGEGPYSIETIVEELGFTFRHTEGFDQAGKIGSYHDELFIGLEQTPKVIKVVKQLSSETILIGFKLLTNVTQEVLIGVAKELMDKNHCDFVLANDLAEIKKGAHVGYLITKQSEADPILLNGKGEIADRLASIALGVPV